MEGLIFIFAKDVLLAIGWLPIAGKFFRAWRDRRNPISLAICCLVMFVAFANWAVARALDGGGPRLIWGVRIASIIVLAMFYGSLMWAKKTFPDGRGKE